MGDDIEKHVDESWKEAIQKEKVADEIKKGAQQPPVEVSFGLFITGLMMEAMMALVLVDLALRAG